jgi:hypothetical protein
MLPSVVNPIFDDLAGVRGTDIGETAMQRDPVDVRLHANSANARVSGLHQDRVDAGLTNAKSRPLEGGF